MKFKQLVNCLGVGILLSTSGWAVLPNEHPRARNVRPTDGAYCEQALRRLGQEVLDELVLRFDGDMRAYLSNQFRKSDQLRYRGNGEPAYALDRYPGRLSAAYQQGGKETIQPDEFAPLGIEQLMVMYSIRTGLADRTAGSKEANCLKLTTAQMEQALDNTVDYCDWRSVLKWAQVPAEYHEMLEKESNAKADLIESVRVNLGTGVGTERGIPTEAEFDLRGYSVLKPSETMLEQPTRVKIAIMKALLLNEAYRVKNLLIDHLPEDSSGFMNNLPWWGVDPKLLLEADAPPKFPSRKAVADALGIKVLAVTTSIAGDPKFNLVRFVRWKVLQIEQVWAESPHHDQLTKGLTRVLEPHMKFLVDRGVNLDQLGKIQNCSAVKGDFPEVPTNEELAEGCELGSEAFAIALRHDDKWAAYVRNLRIFSERLANSRKVSVEIGEKIGDLRKEVDELEDFLTPFVSGGSDPFRVTPENVTAGKPPRVTPLSEFLRDGNLLERDVRLYLRKPENQEFHLRLERAYGFQQRWSQATSGRTPRSRPRFSLQR